MVFLARGLTRLTHFLVPQESNNYKAKILHNQSISVFALVFLVFQILLSSVLLIKPKILGYASSISLTRVAELTNQERIRAGAPSLALNSLLTEAAVRKAGDMVAFDYWAHVSPSGREPWAFFREVGYNYTYAGENLARDFSSAEAAVAAWMASPSHRENLLNGRYQEIGIAVVDGTLGGVETTLIVQLFGTRSPQPAKVVQKTPPAQAIAKEMPKISPQPTIVVQVSPEPLKYPVLPVSQTSILSRSSGKEIPVFNPFTITQLVSFSVLAILLGLFLADAMLVWKQRVIRLSGRPLAHALFLFGMILMILFSQQGAIL